MRTRVAAELDSLLAEYLDHLRAARYSRSLLERAERELPRLFEHLRRRGVRRARAVREEHLLAYLAARRQARTRSGAPLSEWTHAATVSAVRGFFGYLARTGTILLDPASEIPLPKVRWLPRDVLTEAQARRLMAAPFPASVLGKRDRAVLETLYGTALRVSELVGCDRGDLDLAQGLLLVRNGKGRKDRVVPVPGRAQLALGVYLTEARPQLETQPTPALFLSRFGQRLGPVSVHRLARHHGLSVRVRVSPHILRHTCATHLLKGGASVRHVQQLLGHRRLTTTALYTRVAIADLREVLARAHPRPLGGPPQPQVAGDVVRAALLRAHPRRTGGDPAEG